MVCLGHRMNGCLILVAGHTAKPSRSSARLSSSGLTIKDRKTSRRNQQKKEFSMNLAPKFPLSPLCMRAN